MDKFMQEGGETYFNFYLNSDKSVNFISQVFFLHKIFFTICFFLLKEKIVTGFIARNSYW